MGTAHAGSFREIRDGRDLPFGHQAAQGLYDVARWTQRNAIFFPEKEKYARATALYQLVLDEATREAEPPAAAVAESPDFKPAHIQLGITYFRMGQKDKAAKAWKMSTAQRPIGAPLTGRVGANVPMGTRNAGRY